MPLGVQIATLFADGVSYLTTEKTLTDHGISAVAEQDCAVWRVFQGEDICRPNADDATLLASAGTDADTVPDGDTIEIVEAGPGDVDVVRVVPAPTAAMTETATDRTEPVSWTKPPAIETASLPPAAEFEDAPVPADEEPEEVTLEDARLSPPAPEVTVEELPPPAMPKTETETPMPVTTATAIEAPPSAMPAAVAEGPPPPPAPTPESAVEKATLGGTFYVIASYRRLANASRFARAKSELKTMVLAGTANGKSVFRVAVGPFAGSDRQEMRARLGRAGITDAWALRLKDPEIVVETAAPPAPQLASAEHHI